MKNRAKLVKTEQNQAKFISNSKNFSSKSDLSCTKHPSNPSSVGICSYCLTEKLINLVCSDCGEQRTSSCSCSNLSSYRNSSCNWDAGSVGRISFLIENEKGSNKYDKNSIFSNLKLKQSETGDGVLFKRSNSCVVEVKKSNGFWGIGRFFKKRREKEGSSERIRVDLDQESEGCVMNVSRSRSLSAKVLDFNEIGPRKSGIKGGLMDFSGIDDEDEFIDLEIDLFDKSKTEQSGFKMYDQLNGGDRGSKKMKNSHMQAWKWMFKHHSEDDDHYHILKS